MMEMDNKSPKRQLISRLSKMQKAILAYLVTVPQPAPDPRLGGIGVNIGTLPRTGDIIEALGRERTPSSYAAVSKALARLQERGLINTYWSQAYIVGKGYRYAVNPGAPVLAVAA